MLIQSSGYGPDYVYGYSNSSQVLGQMILVDTYEEFSNAVRQNWHNVSASYSGFQNGVSPYTTLRGGLWMGSKDTKPTVMVNVRQSNMVNQIMNLFTVMASGVGISSSYYEFASTKIPELYDLKAMIFIIYFGIIMAW